MTKENFIKTIAMYVQKYAPQFNIKVCSPIIAQACLESAYGTSKKAKHHNYFGLKYRKNRVSCNNGYFEDGGSEQNKDGSYTPLPSDTAWYTFKNIEKGVLGYFQFIDIPNYANLKGVADPYQYLVNIKADGYATSLNYIDNVYKVIEKWNLTQYDNINEKEEEVMGIKIVEKTIKNNPCYKSGRKMTSGKPRGEMLHSVGCPQPDPLVFVKIWDKSTNVAVHAVIGKEKVVYQCLPWNHRGWHGGGSSNNTLIGVEMTEPATIKYTGGSSWVETGNGANTKAHVLATYQNAVELFAYLGKKYNLDVLNSNVVMSHKEGNAKGIASNHGDVEHIWRKFGLTMNQFRKDVKKSMNGQTVTTIGGKVDNSSDDTANQKINKLDGTVTVIYKGKDGLNVRKKPSILDQYVDHVVFEGELFTVTGISADEKWYQLKSGLFISTIPDYVKFKATPEQKESTKGTGYYRVMKAWNNKKTQIGAFKNKDNAIEMCKQNSGYRVYDPNGKEIYPLAKAEKKEFKYKVTVPNLRIRKGAGTTYDYHKKNGKAIYTGEGIFTIVETREGAGAKLWGLLKSYKDKKNGWIAIDDDFGEIIK